MSTLFLIITRLNNIPPELDPAQLLSRLQWNHITIFFATVARLHANIVLPSPQRYAGQVPPLPEPVREALSSVLRLPLGDIDALWYTLGDVALLEGPFHVFDPRVLDHSMAVVVPSLFFGESRSLLCNCQR